MHETQLVITHPTINPDINKNNSDIKNIILPALLVIFLYCFAKLGLVGNALSISELVMNPEIILPANGKNGNNIRGQLIIWIPIINP